MPGENLREEMIALRQGIRYFKGMAVVFVVALSAGLFILALSYQSLHPVDSEAIVFAVKAAEEVLEADPLKEADEKEENTDKLPEQSLADELKAEESKLDPLDDSPLIPTDMYVEKDHSVAFKAYHPQAKDYQWEIYDVNTGNYQSAPEDAVILGQDELLREISSLNLTSDQNQHIRCKISTVGGGNGITYEADLHILEKTVSNIAVEDYSVQAGEYFSTADIPVQVTYRDGTEDEITG